MKTEINIEITNKIPIKINIDKLSEEKSILISGLLKTDEEIKSVSFPNKKEVMSFWKLPKKSNGKNAMKSKKKTPEKLDSLAFMPSVLSPGM